MVSIINVVLGFLVICCGVILLQLSKSAKDVPDAAVFKGDLDQMREVAEQQEPETEPKADAIRGTAAIIRRLSNSRQKMEAEEAKRIQEEKRRDLMEPIGEDEQVEWDGLRRRKTTLSLPAHAGQKRRTVHPPLGMSHFPEEESAGRPGTGEDERGGAIDAGFVSNPRTRAAQSTLLPSKQQHLGHDTPMHPIALTEISLPPHKSTETPATAHFPHGPASQPSPKVWGLPSGLSRQQGLDGTTDASQGRPITWADSTYLTPSNTILPSSAAGPTPPPHSAKRQFSFQNVFHRHKEDDPDRPRTPRQPSRKSTSLRPGSKEHDRPRIKNATEEERMGLVTGDSTTRLSLPEYTSEDDDWQLERGGHLTASPEGSPSRGEKSIEDYEREYERQRREWAVKHDQRDSGLPPEKGPERKDWEGHGPGGGAFI